MTDKQNNLTKPQVVEESIAFKTCNTDFDPELEPLLRENPRRFVIFPIKYHDIWQMYKQVRNFL